MKSSAASLLLLFLFQSLHGNVATGVFLGAAPVRIADEALVGDLASNKEIPGSAIIAEFYPFGLTFTGGVSVASGDINGDGTVDLIAATRSGDQLVRVIDGVAIEAGLSGSIGSSSPALLYEFDAFPLPFSSGVTIASDDVDGDGVDDIILGMLSGGSRLRVVSGADLPVLSEIFADNNPFGLLYESGIGVASGDTNCDGQAEVIACGGGAGLIATVTVFDETGATLSTSNPFGDVAATIDVASGDINGNGYSDIVVSGAQPGDLSPVAVFEGSTGSRLGLFLAYTSAYTGGALVGTADINNDGFDDIITGTKSSSPILRVVDGRKINEIDGNGEIEESALLAEYFSYFKGYNGGFSVSGFELSTPKGVRSSIGLDYSSGAKACVEFFGEEGSCYRLESRLDLESGEWIIEERIEGNGETVVRCFPISVTAKRYFRVLIP